MWWSFETLQTELRRWWRLSTSTDYLTSPVTRRDMFAVAMPILALLNAVADAALFFSPLGLMLDCGLILAALFIFRQPTDMLRADIMFSAAAVLNVAGWTAVNTDPLVLTGNAAFWLAMPMMLGMHSSVLIGYTLASTVALSVAAPEILVTIPYGFIVVAFAAISEKRSASLVADAHQKQKAVDYLVEGASNGFCTVSAEDGTITHSNVALRQTFGSEDVVGARLTEFIKTEDVAHVNQALRAAGAQEVLEPFLVTCQTAFCDFDAKIVPFGTATACLDLCVQVQGERRFRRLRVPGQVARPVRSGDPSISHRSALPTSSGATSWRGYLTWAIMEAGGNSHFILNVNNSIG